jgi:hypothetical protein
MYEIKWGNFKAKFNGKEQDSFELLSYLLFCDEFDKKIGIFRYKNQAGIETEPILVDGKWIGFQAKFYDTKISDNKDELIGSIEKAKRKNPQLDKLLFYLNQEFPESTDKAKKVPKYKTEIEEFGKNEGVEVEWRVPSHFEAQLALDKNRSKAEYFFSLNKGVIEFIDELTQHTQNILETISSKIAFNGCEIKIDRSSTLRNLKTALKASPLVILSGEGGVGKTALIKDFYHEVYEHIPFFIFKGTEFDILHINKLFNNYGTFSLNDFIKEYQDITEKYIIIDSAEKLSDIEDQGAFQEFLSALLKSKWKVIFTTRHSYLEDLQLQLIEVYHQLNFQLYNIENLEFKDLVELSGKHNFRLPKDDRIIELLKNPFYLNKYLQIYEELKDSNNLSEFKSSLWVRFVLSSYHRNNVHRKREECFLRIAQKRANEGHFFVHVDACEDEILHRLETDEVIKCDTNAGGYFITHDIYEEWALDRIIERTFLSAGDYRVFFSSLGSSLPIRRAFRAWLSEKLFSVSSEVKKLIENVINDNDLDDFWKDEVFVSVLLSDYSASFFQLFEAKLLENNQKLLIKLVFLLRIACKELDEDILRLLGIQNIQGNALQTLFTKPKGSGWDWAISFIHHHLGELGLQHINIILPLLDDWVKKNKDGETTRKASQIGLFYYKDIVEKEYIEFDSRNKGKNQLIRVILQGASEIKEELNTIFEEVLQEKWRKHGDRHYALIQTVLTSITDSLEVIKSLPENILSLADLFWFQTDEDDAEYSGMNPRPMHRMGIGVEEHFGISADHSEYSPSSVFQTPLFHLLRFFPKVTTDFILAFTNKTVECYAKSDLDGRIEEVNVFIDETRIVKQYISPRLWNIYRGTQVSPNLLEAIHMALEKWLLECAKISSPEDLERFCKYLISNSRSASITAVVASVVLANTQKLFDIAAILFQTKEFFFYDTDRMLLDQLAKSHYSIGYGLNFDSEFHQDERIKTCDDPHRALSLENIAVNYQFCRTAEESDEEAKRKQDVLWGIFDRHYTELPDKDKETDYDKTWRLYLARMDRRKMHPELQEKDGGILIHFNPEVEPELRKYSEDSLQDGSNVRKYISLNLWANYRFTEEEKYNQYQQYENNPQLVITEIKEILEKLNRGDDVDFYVFNHSTVPYACSVLIRDFYDELNPEDKELCKEVIIEFASLPLDTEHYRYQVSDGAEPCIMSLPNVLKHFPEDREVTLVSLFLLLLNSWNKITNFATQAILQKLWLISFKDAHSLFLGYLLLKQKYDDLREEIRIEKYKNGIYGISKNSVVERFEQQYEKELDSIVSDKIAFEDLGNLEQLDLAILKTAFELLPLRTKNEDQQKFLNIILPVFSKKLFLDHDRVNYALKHRFLEKLAYFILTSSKEELALYLQPFLENFDGSETMSEFFQAFISAEDLLKQYEEFWLVWTAFYEKIVAISKDTYYNKSVIRNYLLAWPYWREDATEWHSLTEREKLFFSKVAADMGHCPTVLYSLSMLLNGIGSNYLEEGISWISSILEKNKNLVTEELETNTIYYIEKLVRKYILKNRQKVRTMIQIKNQVIVILNFLVERGSVTGYLSREEIL